MASDIAQMLKENFLKSIEDNELNLSPTITSLLTEIQNEFIENKVCWSPPPFESLPYFYQLDHTLAESQANKKTFSLFSHLDPVGRSNKNTLIGIKANLIATREKTVNRNTSSKLFTSCMYPSSKDTPNIAVFDEEIEKIVNWLESNDDNGFKAIGVHGMCGTGKTTLVKMVLDDQRVRKKYKKQIWVCLYDLKSKDEMDVKIVKEMLAHLNDDPDLLTEEPEDNWLVERLYGRLEAKKKFLIVLDGVWHCNDWFNDLYDDGKVKVGGMSKLFSEALPKNTGGVVIVTSRQKEVTTNLVHEENLIHLKPWGEEKLKELVKQCLGKHGKSPMTMPQEKIDFVTYHCHGLPLVAVMLSDWIAEQDHRHKKSGSDL